MGDATDQREPAEHADTPAPTTEAVIKNDNAPNSDPAAGGGEGEHSESPSGSNFDLAMLRWTKVVGFFTAVLAIVGIIQVRAFVQSERAFLTLDSLIFDPGALKIGEPIPAVLMIKNSGRAAAFLTDMNLSVRLVDNLPSTPQYDKMQIQSYAAIVPGEAAKIGVTTSKAISEVGMANYQSGSARFFIYGFFSWSDEYSLFGSRKEGFCYTYNRKPLPGLGPFDRCDEPEYTYYR